MAQISTEALQSIACFSDLSGEEALKATRNMTALHLVPGQTLIQQGEPGDSLYLLVSGIVEIVIDVEEQEPLSLALLEAGSIFGEVSLLSGEARSASAVARTYCVAWRVSRAGLESSLARRELWAERLVFEMAQNLARRLAEADRQMVALFMKVKNEAKHPAVKKAELELLRTQLITKSTF